MDQKAEEVWEQLKPKVEAAYEAAVEKWNAAWAVIDPKPRHSRVHYGVRVLYLGLIVLPNTILGAVITFSRSIIYTGYQDVYQPFDMSLLTDQQIGGLMLWVPGDMMSILVAGIVMIMWYEREEAANNASQPAP